MLALIYIGVTIYAAVHFYRRGARTWVYPADSGWIAISLVFFGLLALVPPIFLNLGWFSGILSLIGWAGWAWSLALIQQVTKRADLWNQASALKLSPAGSMSHTKRHRPF